jgi:uncharacterized protein (DUF697 family)
MGGDMSDPDVGCAGRAATKNALIAGGVGIVGAFGAHADIPFLIGIWVKMTLEIADCMGRKLDKDRAKKLVTGVITGIGGFVGGVKLANTYFAYTGIGTIPAILANVGTNGSLTYIYGKALTRVFASESKEFTIDTLIATIVALITGSAGSAGGGGGAGSAST